MGILQWSIAQNSKLTSSLRNLNDSISFTKDDFNILKNTLRQCISFFKFHDLISQEFLKNVFPYREILPEDMYVDLLKMFLDSNYKPTKKLRQEEIRPVKEIVETKSSKLEITDKVKNS